MSDVSKGTRMHQNWATLKERGINIKIVRTENRLEKLDCSKWCDRTVQ